MKKKNMNSRMYRHHFIEVDDKGTFIRDFYEDLCCAPVEGEYLELSDYETYGVLEVEDISKFDKLATNVKVIKLH